MKFIPRWALPVLLMTGISSLALGHSNGPLVSHTGAPAIGNKPAENSCSIRLCHGNNPINKDGAVEILGLPPSYVGGTTYPITVRLSSTATESIANRRWGFELTAVSDATGDGAGLFDPQGLRLSSGIALMGTRRYVSHNAGSFHEGESSPVTWEFAWTAPQGSGSITFYIAADAGDGTGDVANDFIYLASVQVQGELSPVNAATWGTIKASWGASSFD